MKNVIITLMAMAIMAFAQAPKKYYQLNFCTNVYGVEYCAEHDASLRLREEGGRIVIGIRKNVVFDMYKNGDWKLNKKSGERAVNVTIDGNRWKLTDHGQYYKLTDGACATVYIWDTEYVGNRQSTGYVTMDTDEMLKFMDKCDEKSAQRPKKVKNAKKIQKYDGSIPTLG